MRLKELVYERSFFSRKLLFSLTAVSCKGSSSGSKIRIENSGKTNRKASTGGRGGWYLGGFSGDASGVSRLFLRCFSVFARQKML